MVRSKKLVRVTNYPKAILFDADGTLYDSNYLHFLAYQTASKHLYNFDFSWKLFEHEVLRGNKKAPEVLSKHGISVDSKEFYEHKDKTYSHLAKRSLQTSPGLIEFLHWCQHKNIRCIVVSASRQSQLELSLDHLKISSFFENVIALESVGDFRKPHPYPYLKGLQEAGLSPNEALAVEDTRQGIVSAKAAGLRCIGIRNETNSPDELTKADFIISDFNELKEHLGTEFAH
jgi:HAD superfamily hydrolase (TIGR01509 family)